MKKRLLVVILIAIFGPALNAQEKPVLFLDVKVDQVGLFKDVLDTANNNPGPHQINLLPADDGTTTMFFDAAEPGSDDRALGPLTGHLVINGQCGDVRCGFSPAPGREGTFGFLRVAGDGHFGGANLHFSGFGTARAGGVFLSTDSGEIDIFNSEISNNIADFGGGFSIQDQSRLTIDIMQFRGNIARLFGDDVDVESSPPGGLPAFTSSGSLFTGGKGVVSIDNPLGDISISHSTLTGQLELINTTGGVELNDDIIDAFFSSPFVIEDNSPRNAGKSASKPEALCNDFGTGAVTSLGYNIASDDSCALDQETDLPSTDPMLAENEDGLPVPQPGSPAIDSGPVDVIVFEGDTLASLPCGYRDISGTARPQDASGDGVFECDRGAMEVPGGGAIVPGHSSVFFNPQRSGEGNYVEILDGGQQAIVYTFTYNPDGTGPAWFLGVGNVNGNSLVLDGLARPTGTPFGDDFDAAEIEFTPAGSMSMVFPDCQASAPGGNIAYTGNVTLGYEGLITRATRLAHIMGCGAEIPHPNAGLSGSFFDPARNGEGLIVEWLTNGDVLVVFFTYDPDGNQFWLFGQAAANGKSVTMNAVYPTAFTPWGRDYDPDDVSLDTWGTFTLTWTDCNTMTFEYSSTVGDFGAATRNYTRLSTLAGTNCPAFP